MINKIQLVIISLVGISILVIHFIPNVQAQTTPYYKILYVGNSEACNKLLTNNLNSTCPEINKIWKYDTTNKVISGKLGFDGKKFYRTNPEFKQHYMYYKNMTVCIMCDLPLGELNLFKIIFLESSSFQYTDKTATVNNTNVFISFKDRYVTPDCMIATIKYSDQLLNDTINYMLSNCTITHFNMNQTNIMKITPFQFNNPYSSLNHYNWIKQIKSLKIENCITKKCKLPVNPDKKKNW